MMAMLWSCDSDSDKTPENPVTEIQMPSSDTVYEPGAQITIMGKGFTSGSRIWFRSTLDSSMLEGETAEVTQSKIVVNTPDAVSGKQTVILKQNGGEWVIGTLEFEGSTHTMLLYLAIDNNFNLQTDYYAKINALTANWKKEYKGNIAVYADSGNKNPVLVNIRYDEKRGISVADTVINYNESQNSASAEILRRIMNDTAERFPADTYGLVFLSHSSGWLPKGSLANPQSIGQDTGDKTGKSNEMELRDFAQALPYDLEYIFFDSCFMGAIEVAYELKDRVRYVAGSPAEVLVMGEFIYGPMVAHLMEGEPDIVAVARDFFEYFDAQTGSTRSATISVVDTGKLEPVAEIARELLDGVDGEALVDVSSIQNFRPGSSYLYFDFGDYIKALYPDRFDEFMDVLDEVFVYKANTPTYYSNKGADNEIRAFSGLTIYIPQAQYPFMNSEYLKLKWAKAVGTHVPSTL